MFIRMTKNKRGINYYHLVESYRNEEGKNRQKILLSLGTEFDHKLNELANSIAKYLDIPSLKTIEENLDIEKAYILGPLLLVQKIIQKLGISEILDKIAEEHPRLGFNLSELVFTMIACRFISPCSKLRIHDYWLDQFYPQMVNSKIELHQLYRALNLLYSHKDSIETELLAIRKKRLKLPIDVVLYDLTTLRFESTCNEEGKLRQFGYSKEKRSDCTQVVLGLLVDPEGMPLGFEVFPGNTFEGSTIHEMTKKIRDKFAVRRFIFVGDRALFSDKNFKELEESKAEYVIGMKLALFKQKADEFYDINRFTFTSADWAFYETKHDERRCVITWSKDRAARDKKVREDILSKIGKKINSKKVTAKTFISNSNYLKYINGTNTGHPVINQQAIDNEAKKDGFFGIITNIKEKDSNELISIYKSLWIVEDAFGELKGFLKTRPIYHWTDKRIIGHIMVCFLAYLCESYMTKVLREQKINLLSKSIENGKIEERPLTVAMAINDLKALMAIPVSLTDRTIWVSTNVPENAKKLFDALKIKSPTKILKIENKTSTVVHTKQEKNR